MHTLYQICLEILSDFADLVPDYSTVPYEPFVQDLLRTIMARPWRDYERGEQRKARCKALDAIGKAHAAHIREKSEWTGVSVGPPSDTPALKTISQRLPHFVCHLNLTGCARVGNESIYQLKSCIHLRTLDLTRTGVTDPGVATLARIGLRYLRHLSVADNPITDGSLRHIAEIARNGSLEGVDLTATHVDEAVATRFLAIKGFEQYRHQASSSTDPGKRLIGWNLENPSGHGVVVAIQTSPWLADLAMDRLRPSGRFASPPAKSKNTLIYTKTESNVPPAACQSEDNDAEGRSRKKPKLRMDDYLSLIEEDLGLV